MRPSTQRMADIRDIVASVGPYGDLAIAAELLEEIHVLTRERHEARNVARMYQAFARERWLSSPNGDATIERWDREEREA